MKIKIGFILIFCLQVLQASAQQFSGDNSIEGNIIDSANHKPIIFASVSLMDESKHVVKNTLTKDDGTFIFEKLKAGKYILSLAAIGYQTKIIAITLSDTATKNVDLGVIRLKSQVKLLNEVTISASRPVVKQEVDRLIYDVHADPGNKGLNILEVLSKVPFVSVDGDDNILLKGKANFKIFVNGRPSGVMASNPAEALRIMRSTNVKKIEVITTPPAKYDGEGIAGIINIVTKTDVEGWSFAVEAFHGSRLGSWGSGAELTVKKGKLGINGYIGKYLRRNVPTGTFLNTRTDSTRQVTTNSGTSDMHGSHMPVNADVSYEIDSLNLITASIASYSSNITVNDLQVTNTVKGGVNSSYQSNVESNVRNGTMDLGVNYQLGFKNKKDRLLTASYKYATIVNDFNSYSIATGQMNDTSAQTNNAGAREHTVQLDYVQPAKKITTEIGGKIIWRDNFSDFSSQTNQVAVAPTTFDYSQTIYSLYNSYALKMNKWNLSAGVRLENTVVNGNMSNAGAKLDRNYCNLIPSVLFLYKLKKSQNINLGYTQRIQRPGIVQLNPFENQSNPMYYTSGNPGLTEVVYNSFNLSYNILRKNTINIGLDYLEANNTIQNVVSLGNDGITRSTFANIGKDENLGASLTLNIPILKNLRYNFNSHGQYIWLAGTAAGQEYNTKGFMLTTSNDISYTAPYDWRIRFQLATNSPVISLQGQTNAYVNSVFSVNKLFFKKKKLGMIFRIDNPTGKNRVTINQFNTQGFVQVNRFERLARGYYLNFYYTFGELKDKIKTNKHGVENNDVDKGKSGMN